VEKLGAGVEVLATSHDHPVGVRQGRLLATSFHPEVTGDHRMHEMFVGMLRD
ncbi:MAG TPA: pyridoxal 5'-phosphate synthase glutaminase subunit PdxT, partial [Micromonosporaceae bacterium]|nr:pyridoxal 5'-phosphate synthase glutaminase subunit PdxT [Micromonosporaceae bacterium]